MIDTKSLVVKHWEGIVIIRVSRVNTYILALYFFQYGLVLPLILLVGSSWPVSVSTICLTIGSLIINRNMINKKSFFFFVMISIFFLSNILIVQQGFVIVLSVYVGFLIKSYTAFFVGGLKLEMKYIYDIFYKIALVNAFIVSLMFFLGMVNDEQYMRFGYALLPSVIIFLDMTISSKKNKLLWASLAIVTLMLMTFYGSRGPIIAVIIWIILSFMFDRKYSIKMKVMLFSASSVLLYFAIKLNLLLKVLNYIYYNLGIQTYAIEKFIMMMDVGLAESSSGRNAIYLSMWQLIKNNLVLGLGIGSSQIHLDMTAHNIFLQILLESGMLGLTIWIVVWMYCLKKFMMMYRNRDTELLKITILIGAVSIGRLLVSSDMWLRPEYWMLIAILINYNPKINLKRKYNDI